MITGRNVLFVTLIVAVVSLLAATLSWTSTSKFELGGNTFGVRSHGLRGLFEILQELDISTERVVGPPTESRSADTTLVFLAPDRELVEIEPAYLQNVAEWVRLGGRVVYSPSRTQSRREGLNRGSRSSDRPAPKTFLELMGISDVLFSSVQISESDEQETVELLASSPKAPASDRDVRDLIETTFSREAPPMTSIAVHAEGDWEGLAKSVSTLAVPQRDLHILKIGDTEPQGRIVTATDMDAQKVLAASFRVGEGEVVVLSDPAMAQNRFVAEHDNAVLLVELLAGQNSNVVFDEFYHGLTARGNPLVLLQRPAFSLLLVLLCVTLGAYAWRHGRRLGPAMRPVETPRRSLSEYVEAMARLFAKAKNATPFLLRENRNGLLWMLRNELGLSASKHATAEIHTLLARRDPKRAERFVACMRELDELLERQTPSDRDALDAMKRAADCL